MASLAWILLTAMPTVIAEPVQQADFQQLQSAEAPNTETESTEQLHALQAEKAQRKEAQQKAAAEKHAEQQIQDLQDKSAHFQHELARAQEAALREAVTRREATQRVLELQAANSALQKKFDVSQAEAKQRIQDLTERLMVTQQKAGSEDKAMHQVRELKAAKSELLQHENYVKQQTALAEQASVQEIRDLGDKLRAARQKAASKGDLLNKVQQLQVQTFGLRQRLNSSEAKAAQEKAAEKKEMLKAAHQKSASGHDHMDQVRHLQAENSDLQQRLMGSERKAARQEAAVEQLFKGLQQKVNAAEQKAASEEEALRHMSALKAQNSELREQLEIAQRNVSQAKAAAGDWAMEQVQELNVQVKNLREKAAKEVSTFEEDTFEKIQDLQAKNMYLQRILSDSKKQTAQHIAALTHEAVIRIQNMQAKNAHLQQKLKTSQAEVAQEEVAAEKGTAEYTQQIHALQTEAAYLQAELQNAQEDADRQGVATQNLEVEDAYLERMLVSSEHEAGQLKHRAEQKLDQMRTEFAQAQEEEGKAAQVEVAEYEEEAHEQEAREEVMAKSRVAEEMQRAHAQVASLQKRLMSSENLIAHFKAAATDVTATQESRAKFVLASYPPKTAVPADKTKKQGAPDIAQAKNGTEAWAHDKSQAPGSSQKQREPLRHNRTCGTIPVGGLHGRISCQTGVHTSASILLVCSMGALALAYTLAAKHNLLKNNVMREPLMANEALG